MRVAVLRRRLVPLVAAGLVATAAGAVAGVAGPASATTSTFTTTSVTEAPDFAVSTFGDAWDYSNSSDLLMDGNGPTLGTRSISMIHGAVTFTGLGGGYISPLWGGYPGSELLGRDGLLPANTVDAGYYTRLHLHVYASAPVSVGMFWYRCGQGGLSNSRCGGGMGFHLAAGWQDVDLAIQASAAYNLPLAWSGRMEGIRLAYNPSTATTISIDFLRLYHPDPAAQTTWRSPSGCSTLYWSDGSVFPGAPGARNGGPVRTAAGAATSCGEPHTVDLSGYPDHSVFYAVSGGARVGDAIPVIARPAPQITSPTAAGCGDWALRYLGHSWTFTSTRSLARWQNLTSMSFSGGAVTATNAPPVRNDPAIYLPVGPGIDGRWYNQLTITSSYVGPFNLANAPGGGSMGRIVWQLAGQPNVAQTKPLVTYTGKRSISIDLSRPGSVITDPSGASNQRYGFSSTSKVVLLRWDPNEDPGARRWTVYSVQLAGKCGLRTTFPMTWQDNRYVAGSTAVVTAVPWGGGTAHTLGQVTEVAGTNTFTVQAASVPSGTYRLVVTVTGPTGAVNQTSSSGPLLKP